MRISDKFAVVYQGSVEDHIPGEAVSPENKEALIKRIREYVSALQRNGASDQKIDDARQALIAAVNLPTHTISAVRTSSASSSHFFQSMDESPPISDAPIESVNKKKWHFIAAGISGALLIVSIALTALAITSAFILTIPISLSLSVAALGASLTIISAAVVVKNIFKAAKATTSD